MSQKTFRDVEHVQCIVGHQIDGNLSTNSPSGIKLFDEHDEKSSDPEILRKFAHENSYDIGCFIQYKEGGMLRRPFIEFDAIDFSSNLRPVFSQSLGGDYVSLNIPFTNGICRYLKDGNEFKELFCEEGQE